MKYASHLSLEEVLLSPSHEWQVSVPGWCFIRISDGQGYWLGPGLAQELSRGDVVVASPATPGYVRASQLQSITLNYFCFCPVLLVGFLTLPERRRLETDVEGTGTAPARFRPGDPVAERFTFLCENRYLPNALLLRAVALQVAASAFNNHLVQIAPGEPTKHSADKRLEALIHKLADEKILDLDAAELADHCGCSRRYLNDLFRKQLGVSLRAKKTEIRLLKASQLLLASDAPISSVAEAVGYRNAGTFASLFKKYFGMSPAKWSRQNRASRPAGSDFAPQCCRVPLPGEAQN